MQVDGHEVAVDGRSVDDLELGVVLAQTVELAIDLLVAHAEAGQGDLQPVVAGDGDERPHLDHRVEGDGARVLAAGDVDLGLRDRVELGVDHGAGVEVGQRLAQRLGPQRAGAAHARLEHLARHLARTEARHADLLGERPHDVAQGAVELGLVDLHAQADEVALQGSAVARITSRTLYRPRSPDRRTRSARTTPRQERRARTCARRATTSLDAGGSLEHEVHGPSTCVRPPRRLPCRSRPAASTCAAVARPQPSRTKSRLESESVTVGVHLVRPATPGHPRPPR